MFARPCADSKSRTTRKRYLFSCRINSIGSNSPFFITLHIILKFKINEEIHNKKIKSNKICFILVKIIIRTDIIRGAHFILTSFRFRHIAGHKIVQRIPIINQFSRSWPCCLAACRWTLAPGGPWFHCAGCNWVENEPLVFAVVFHWNEISGVRDYWAYLTNSE